MCGIVGLQFSCSTVNTNQISSIISRMTSMIISRGPDESGSFISPTVALGHRRLSILDLSETGAQPMKFDKNSPVIVYNGEVYNFQDLRADLNSLGYIEWRGHSDTEVILHVYAKWGLEGLKRLEGVFALAIWDPQTERLILMRDRLGVKPLFYGQSQYGLAFGSEIKAVLAAGGVDLNLDDQAFSEYLWYGNTHGDRSFYRGVRALQPGYWLIVQKGKQVLEPWWRIEEWLENPLHVRDNYEAAYLVRKSLDQAVKRQLVADVPVGIFLSGGVDSSAIAASAVQYSSQLLKSYSAGFDFVGGTNELPKAALVARHLNLDHHELRICGGELQSTLLRLSDAHDEPFADAANIPLYLMCQQLQGQVKVVLQGDGGDELFAGYRRYAILRNTRWWKFFPRALIPFLRKSGDLGKRITRIAEAIGSPDTALRMAYLLTTETQHQHPGKLLQVDRLRQLEETADPFSAYRDAAVRFENYDPIQQMLLTDLTVQLPSQFLTKVDRATMAAGIEARVPLLDENVARLAIRLPSSWKVKGFQTKTMLRYSQQGRLPNSILNGPKTGFGVPYEEWLRTSLFVFARDYLLDRNFLEEFSLDAEKVELMLSLHQQRRADRGFMLWKLLQLAIWNSHTRLTVRTTI